MSIIIIIIIVVVVVVVVVIHYDILYHLSVSAITTKPSKQSHPRSSSWTQEFASMPTAGLARSVRHRLPTTQKRWHWSTPGHGTRSTQARITYVGKFQSCMI